MRQLKERRIFQTSQMSSDEELSFIRASMEKAYNIGEKAGWLEGYQEAENDSNENEI